MMQGWQHKCSGLISTSFWTAKIVLKIRETLYIPVQLINTLLSCWWFDRRLKFDGLVSRCQILGLQVLLSQIDLIVHHQPL
jgi:hypothetical protein